MPQESAEIFKQDTKGRVRVPKARREAVLDEYERSGSSAAQFANYVGIKYSTLANWIQKRRKQERLKRPLLKQGEGAGQWRQTNGRWVEAVVERCAEPKAKESSLRM